VAVVPARSVAIASLSGRLRSHRWTFEPLTRPLR